MKSNTDLMNQLPPSRSLRTTLLIELRLLWEKMDKKKISNAIQSRKRVELEGKETPKVCMICRKTIQLREEGVECLECHTCYHETHLGEWMKIHKRCPICQVYMHQVYGRKKIKRETVREKESGISVS